MTTITRTPEREPRIAAWMDQERESVETAFGAGAWPTVRAFIDSCPWQGSVERAAADITNESLRTGPQTPEESTRYTSARRTFASLSHAELVDVISERTGVRRQEVEGWICDLAAGDAPTDGEDTALYRHFDADDRLLYVGIASDPDQRHEQHRRSSPWWRFVARTEVEWHGSRTRADTAERAAIDIEAPLFNKAHNAHTREAAIEYLFAQVEASAR